MGSPEEHSSTSDARLHASPVQSGPRVDSAASSDSAGSDLPPGQQALLVYSVRWAMPAEAFRGRPTVPAGGWDGVGGSGGLRGEAHSLAGTTDPAQMGPLRNNACRCDGSVFWEPGATHFGQRPWGPGRHPSWLGIRRPRSSPGPAPTSWWCDGNRPGGAVRRAAFASVPACPWRRCLFPAAAPPALQEKPCPRCRVPQGGL